jgi:hypothetical protein
MSNNYDMAYFNREQSIVGIAELKRPYSFDPERLGYRPSYPEEDAKRERERTRPKTFDLVKEAKKRAEAERAAAG